MRTVLVISLIVIAAIAVSLQLTNTQVQVAGIEMKQNELRELVFQLYVLADLHDPEKEMRRCEVHAREAALNALRESGNLRSS